MGMPAIVEDSPQRLTGAQLGRAITRHWAQLNAGNHHLLRMIAEFDRRGDWREQGAMRSCAHWLVARPLAEGRQDEWQAKQKARMQAVARKLLQRGGANPEAVVEDAPGRADPGVVAAGGAQRADPGLGIEDGTRQGLPAETSTDRVNHGLRTETAPDSSIPEATAASPVGEVLPNHLAYARAEEKISAETFSQQMNQVRADALVAMVEHFLASGPDFRGLPVSRLPGIRVLGCPSYPALGRGRGNPAGQPGDAVSIPSPAVAPPLL